jgi:hypothetical protein
VCRSKTHITTQMWTANIAKQQPVIYSLFLSIYWHAETLCNSHTESHSGVLFHMCVCVCVCVCKNQLALGRKTPS